MNFSHVSCGQVNSIAALANSPAYMRGHDLTNATFVRFVTALPNEPRIHVLEAACAHNKQFCWSYSRPNSDYAALVEGMRQTTAGEAALTPFIDIFFTPSMQTTAERMGRVIVLEHTSEMEAYIVHIRSE